MDSTCGVLLSFKGRIILQIIPISLPPAPQKRAPSRCIIIGFETHFYFSLHSKLCLCCCVHMVFLCFIINPPSRLFVFSFARNTKNVQKMRARPPSPQNTHNTSIIMDVFFRLVFLLKSHFVHNFRLYLWYSSCRMLFSL